MAFEADEMFINYQELQNSKQTMAVSLYVPPWTLMLIKQCISLSLSLPMQAEFDEQRDCLSHEISDLKSQLQALQKKLLRAAHPADKV